MRNRKSSGCGGLSLVRIVDCNEDGTERTAAPLIHAGRRLGSVRPPRRTSANIVASAPRGGRPSAQAFRISTSDTPPLADATTVGAGHSHRTAGLRRLAASHHDGTRRDKEQHEGSHAPFAYGRNRPGPHAAAFPVALARGPSKVTWRADFGT